MQKTQEKYPFAESFSHPQSFEYFCAEIYTFAESNFEIKLKPSIRKEQSRKWR
jgi:hypothetical protein